MTNPAQFMSGGELWLTVEEIIADVVISHGSAHLIITEHLDFKELCV